MEKELAVDEKDGELCGEQKYGEIKGEFSEEIKVELMEDQLHGEIKQELIGEVKDGFGEQASLGVSQWYESSLVFPHQNKLGQQCGSGDKRPRESQLRQFVQKASSFQNRSPLNSRGRKNLEGAKMTKQIARERKHMTGKKRRLAANTISNNDRPSIDLSAGEMDLKKGESRESLGSSCGKGQWLLKERQLTHKEHDSKSCVCSICGKVCKNRKHLWNHMVCHRTKSKAYSCDDCGKCFKQQNDVTRHKNYYNQSKPYMCEKCGLLFKYHYLFAMHHLTHIRIMRYNCDLCQKKFSSMPSLRLHIISHVVGKAHKCNLCERSFSRKSYVRLHMRVHTGEKPYKCICGRDFSDSSSFYKHKKTHYSKEEDNPEQKRCPCDLCGMTFKKKHLMRQHRTIHTGERPYKCDLCNETFRRQSSLHNHRYKHQREGPLKCNICIRAFKTKTNLLRHISTEYHRRKKMQACCTVLEKRSE